MKLVTGEERFWASPAHNMPSRALTRCWPERSLSSALQAHGGEFMRRAMKRTLTGILAIVVLMLAFSEITGRITYSRIHKRVSYWESLVDKELPPGSAKESVQQWGKITT
jgi:hypothetical protein